MAAARATDPDPVRDRLRVLWSQTDLKAQRELLRKLMQEADPDTWPAQSMILLAGALVEAGDQEAAAGLLRRAQLRHPGDIWINYHLGSILERVHPPRTEEAILFYTAARALRPETAHVLAHALQSSNRGDQAAAVFQDLVRLRPAHGLHWACYARLLKEHGMESVARDAFNRAIADLRARTQLKPNAAAAHYELGKVLRNLGELDEAIAESQTALRLNPDFADAHNNLGNALHDQGNLDEAVAEYQTAIRLNPDFADAHYNLGVTRCEQVKPDEGILELRTAIRLKPNFAAAHNNLGNVLNLQGKQDGAVAEYRTAICLEPDFAKYHYNLGLALCKQKKLDEGVIEYQTAIRLKPDLLEPHKSLALALYLQGRLDEAIAEYQTAIRLRPDDGEAHNNLGLALKDRRQLNEAVDAYRQAIRLKPNLAEPHCNLGDALWEKGENDTAIAEYRAAIHLKSDYARAHCNLGLVLQQQGDYSGALEMLRKGHELGTCSPDWRYPSAGWVANAERLLALSQRLPAVLRGQDKPHDSAERLVFAQMAFDRKHFIAAARFWAEALASEPKLGDDRRTQHRYNAACAAILAASGQGKDDPPPDDAAKARLRTLALDWLKAELVAWTKLLESGPSQARPGILQTLDHWKVDPDLAGIRDAAGLDKLPEPERKTWQALWADLEGPRKRAGGKTP